MSEDFFAPPPFDPEAALATLRRALRELGLAERGGAFELKGLPVAQAAVDGGALRLQVAKRPSRSPDWEQAQARDHAQLRRFTDDLKKRLARWADGQAES